MFLLLPNLSRGVAVLMVFVFFGLFIYMLVSGEYHKKKNELGFLITIFLGPMMIGVVLFMFLFLYLETKCNKNQKTQEPLLTAKEVMYV